MGIKMGIKEKAVSMDDDIASDLWGGCGGRLVGC
jgi:hypothetical protein